MNIWINHPVKKTYQKSIVKNVIKFLIQNKNTMIIIQNIHLEFLANHAPLTQFWEKSLACLRGQNNH
jgi:hypothetical protein